MSRPSALGHDFVARKPRGSAAGWLCLLLGLALAGGVALDWTAARDDAARWSAKAEHWQAMAKRAGHGSVAVSGDAASLRPQIEAAAKAVDRLAIPWGELYRSLESTVDDSVSLLAILPNAEKGELRIAGEAKDFPALRAYLQRLGDSGSLSEVRLLGQEIKQNDPQHPIAFTIAAAWRKAT